jgi:hypothetical protein
MKSSLRKLFTSLLAVIALTITSSAPPALAADVIKTNNFTGFAFEKAVLTPSMKSKIKAWVLATAKSNFTLVSCTGYTGFNANQREQQFLQTLAVTRSQNVCDYIHTIKDVLTINSVQGVPGNGKTANARRVTVRLIAPDAGNGGGGNGGGTGEVVIGVCDNSLKVTMRSRVASNEFYFASITIKEIATTCKNKALDIYFLDAEGNQLGVSTDNVVTTTSLMVAFTFFSPNNVKSNEIKKVAFEFRDR